MWQAIGAGAQVAGGAIEAIAAQLANAEMKRQFDKELINQGKYQEGSRAAWQGDIPTHGSEQANVDLAKGEKQRLEGYDKVKNVSLAPGQQLSNAGSLNFEQRAGARAKLRAYSNWELEKMMRDLQLRAKLQKIANFSQGDAAVFPAVMQDAQHSQDQLAFWGKLIGSVGGTAANFGQMNAVPQQAGQFPSNFGSGTPIVTSNPNPGAYGFV